MYSVGFFSSRLIGEKLCMRWVSQVRTREVYMIVELIPIPKLILSIQARRQREMHCTYHPMDKGNEKVNRGGCEINYKDFMTCLICN